MAKEHNQQKEELTEEEKRQRLRRVYKLLVEFAVGCLALPQCETQRVHLGFGLLQRSGQLSRVQVARLDLRFEPGPPQTQPLEIEHETIDVFA